MKYLLATLLCCLCCFLHAEVTDAGAFVFLQKNFPQIHEKLSHLEKTEPSDFRNVLDDAKVATSDYAKITSGGDTAAAAAFLKMYAIDFEAIAVADKIVASTDPAQKEELTKKLKQLVAESLEQWIIVEQSRINRMESELAKLKLQFNQSITDKNTLIENDSTALIQECRDYQQEKKQKQK